MKTAAELKEVVREYCRSKGWQDDDLNVREVLLYGDTVYTQVDGSHRWWNDVFRVVKVGDTLIGCWGAQTTGDNSPSDVGWEFDWNSLCEVERKEIVTVVYKPVSDSLRRQPMSDEHVELVGGDRVEELIALATRLDRLYDTELTNSLLEAVRELTSELRLRDEC